MNPTFDLIIQGPIYPWIFEIISDYKKLSFVNKIIISSWESYAEYKLLLFDYGVKIVLNQDLQNPGRNNRNRKIKSSTSGLEVCQSDYVIVMRSDILFDTASFENIYSFFLENKEPTLKTINNTKNPLNKIVCINFVQDHPFHPNDWFFMGHKKDLEIFFDIPYDTENDLRAETYFGAHYISLFDERTKLMLDDYKNYFLDNSEKLEEALLLSKQISSKVLITLPKELAKIRLLKYKYDFHDWDERAKTCDLLFHEKDPNYNQ